MMDLSKDWNELPSRVKATRQRAAREMDRPPSPDTQPPWKIPELVLCGAAVSGRIAVEGQDTRNFALDFDSFKREAIAAVKAGAAMVHIDTGGIAAIMEFGLCRFRKSSTRWPATSMRRSARTGLPTATSYAVAALPKISIP